MLAIAPSTRIGERQRQYLRLLRAGGRTIHAHPLEDRLYPAERRIRDHPSRPIRTQWTDAQAQVTGPDRDRDVESVLAVRRRGAGDERSGQQP
jgi:hypothetical protein